MIPDLSLGRRLAELFPMEQRPAAADVERTIEDRINYPTQRFIISCTSTTRPTNPRAGDRIYETDTGREYVYHSSTWVWMGGGDWEVYSPSWTQSAAISHTVNYSRYMREGKKIHWRFSLSATSAGTAGAAHILSLPKTAGVDAAVTGNFLYLDSGYTYFTGRLIGVNTGTGVAGIVISYGNAFGVDTISGFKTTAGASIPSPTAASGDRWEGEVIYEAAAWS